MSSYDPGHLDGNAAAGELSPVFALEVTTAVGQCANCGATKRFAEAHVYAQGPGLVARCAACQNVLLRLAHLDGRVVLELRGMTHLTFDAVPGDLRQER